ncbi:MAG: calcium-binding protein [Cyanobacteria bacterium J06638_38]
MILENTGALTIGGISDTDGVQTSGPIQITTFSPLTVTETLSSVGDITLTATDSAATGDDLTITASAVLSAAEGNIFLQGGDNITIERNGTNPVIQAAGEVLIQGDYGNADPDVGSVMTISGEINAFSVTIQGDSDDDIVDASPISADLLIEGFAGDDCLIGGTGEDTLIGGEGADKLDGGDGTDLATYKDATTSVYINLSTGRGYRGESYGDRFVNLENLEGSEFNDIIKGDNQVNLLLGLGGNDRIFGYGDDDIIEAGAGTDIVRGGDGNDFLDGGEGDDSMLGDRGDDTMMGGLGDDFLRDGVGDNVFAISADDATDKIVDFSRSNNAIALLNGLLSSEVDLLQDSSNTQIMFNNLILATLLRTNPAIVRFVDLDLI